jgi:hypothetical protein
MDDSGAGVMVNTALTDSLMRVLLEAGILTADQLNDVLNRADELLAEDVPSSREEAATIEKAKSLMEQRRAELGQRY